MYSRKFLRTFWVLNEHPFPCQFQGRTSSLVVTIVLGRFFFSWLRQDRAWALSHANPYFSCLSWKFLRTFWVETKSEPFPMPIPTFLDFPGNLVVLIEREPFPMPIRGFLVFPGNAFAILGSRSRMSTFTIWSTHTHKNLPNP